MKKIFLDITKEHCPMTYVKARLKADEMSEGDLLEVLLCEGEPLENVPKSLEENNCKLISSEKKSQFYLLKFEKTIDRNRF